MRKNVYWKKSDTEQSEYEGKIAGLKKKHIESLNARLTNLIKERDDLKERKEKGEEVRNQ